MGQVYLPSDLPRRSPARGDVHCGELQLLPVAREALSFRDTSASLNGANVSTWGSPVLHDNVSGQWHWASEMMYGCGINAWESNSRIVHIAGDALTGSFKHTDVFAPPFAHEPDVVRGPQGEWVILYSAYNSRAPRSRSAPRATTRAAGPRPSAPTAATAAHRRRAHPAARSNEAGRHR